MAKRSAKIAWGRLILVTVLLFAVVMFGTGAGFVLGVLRDLPNLNQVGDIITARSSVIYDRHGEVVATLHDEENRVVVRLEQHIKDVDPKTKKKHGIPKVLQDAVIAIEDHEFYQHRGVNPKAIASAAWLILSRRGFRGGSTITQQLAKNTFLTDEVTLRRKLQEAWYAIQLERRYTKDEILEFYLNKIYFGEGSYGAQAAARTHFDKDVWDLNLAEAALLAGIIQLPEYYSPHQYPDRARARQGLVLDAMVRYGYITQAEADAARKAELKFKRGFPDPTRSDYVGFWFVDHVKRELLETFGKEKVYQGGLKVYTTLDPEMQKAAENSVKQLDKYFEWKPGQYNLEAAAVFMETKTGYVRAMVGGRRAEGQLVHNRAMSPSQPGSTIKPIAVYAPAIESRAVTAGTVFDDVPYYPSQAPYFGRVMWPENWDFKFLGLKTVREALKLSINTIAVRTAERIGTDRMFESVKNFGVTTLVEPPNQPNDRNNLSFALGGLTRGISPLEMGAAYSTFANLGERAKPVTILKVVGPDDQVLLENQTRRFPVVSRETAWIMVDMMKDVIEEGTGGPARLAAKPAGVAGKTGSTNDYADVWWIGYTPDVVGSVWVGYDDHRPNPRITSVGGGFWALKLWKQAMEQIVKAYPLDSDWPRPASLRPVVIDRKSGKLPVDGLTPNETRYTEWFRPGTEPTQLDDVHVKAAVVEQDPKLLYDEWCLGARRLEKVFIRRPTPYRPAPNGRVPADAKDELPTKSCREDPRFQLLPGVPLPGRPGSGQPGQPTQPGFPGQPGSQTTPGPGDAGADDTSRLNPDDRQNWGGQLWDWLRQRR